MEFKEYKHTRDKIYLAYLEEKCHIHPTAEVKFEEDEDLEDGNKAIFARIGGFDSGLRFTEGDILTWFIEQDIKPSEIRDYSKETLGDWLDGVNPVKINTDFSTVHDVTDYTKVKMNGKKIRCGGNTEIEFLIEEKKRNGGGSFEYNGVVYNVDKDGTVTHPSVPRPNYNTAEDTLKMIDADDWK